MGIRLKDITAFTSGLLAAGNTLLTNTSGNLTRLVRWDTLADWILKTYAGFTQSGSGAIADTVEGVLQRKKSVFDYMTAAQRASVIAKNFSEDVTEALQEAITQNITLNGGHLDWPDGGYKITDELDIPASARWKMTGASRGGVALRQYTDNKRIFRFTAANTHSFTISGFRLDYANQQTTSNTASIPISFMADTGTPGAGFYNFAIKDVFFDKCFRCIAHDDSNGAAVWGYDIDNVTYGENVVGSFMYLGDSSSLGHPNGHFGTIHINAESTDVSESIFNLVGCGNTTMGAIEINTLTNGPRIINAGEGTTIDCESMVLEGGTYAVSGARLFNNPDSRMQFGTLKLNTITFNPGAGNAVTVLGYSTGTTGYYKVGVFDLTSPTITSGRLFLSEGTSSSGAATRRAEIDYIRPSQIITDVHLSNLPASAGADAVRVNTWAEPRISNDKGDADYTWAIGDATTIRYDTALSANRTVTLPSISGSAQGSSFNGLEITVYREGLGDFRLDVISSGGIALDSFPPNSTGSITFMFYRFGWKVVRRNVRPSAYTTAVGNVGADEDDLISSSLPARTLNRDGNAVRITAWGTTANNSNPKTVKLYFGAPILTTALTVSQAGVWRITAEVIRTASNAQDYTAQLLQGGATTLIDVENGSLTRTDSSEITIKCTGTVTDGGGGINNDDIVQEGMIVEVMR